jgi:hypothetical protein
MSRILRLCEHRLDRIIDRSEGCSYIRDSVVAWLRDNAPGSELIEDEDHEHLAIRFDCESDLVAFMLRWR